jgi:hypothetical protein
VTGDIGYSDLCFSAAVRLLALGEGSYRERLRYAFAESLHSVDNESSRPVPERLLEQMREFWDHPPVDEMTDEEARKVGEDLLLLASDIDFESGLLNE